MKRYKSETLNNLKTELKTLAAQIREKGKWDHLWKDAPSHYQSLLNEAPRSRYDRSFRFRTLHVAYCLVRGRTMEQIEPRTRQDRPGRAEEVIQSLVAQIQTEIRAEFPEKVFGEVCHAAA